jgi:hypothetical protein
MTPSRSLAPLLAGCLSALALTGCGGGSEGRSTPEEALAKVRASDFARSVNLHASDVPYFEPIPEEEEEGPREERRRERRLERCLGFEDAQEPLVEVESETYGTDSPGELLRVQSSVSVLEDAAQAAEEVRGLLGDRAVGCFEKIYVKALEEDEPSDAEVRGASVSRIADPGGGDIEDDFGYRFYAKVTVQGDSSQLTAYGPTAEPAGDLAESLTIPIYIDIVGFVSGRAAVSLVATGAPSPVSRNLERNLLGVLHERATSRRP